MAAASLGGVACVWAVVRPLPGGGTPASAPVGERPATVWAVTMPADSAVAALNRAAPFRVQRRPSPVAYDPSREPGAESPPARTPPAFVVTGIVWGREPSAVLEGVPGAEGARVVRRGDSVAGFQVMRVAQDRVRLAGLDTSWTLPVRTTW